MRRGVRQFLRKGIRAAVRAVYFALREPRSALLLARMALWVTALSALVRLLPLPRVMKLMTPLHQRDPSDTPPPTTAASPERLAGLLDRLLSLDAFVFTPTCWKRAPILYRYLALHGIETHVVFGVRPQEERGQLAGHAWLEADGHPVLEKIAPVYTVTYRFPSGPASIPRRGG